MVNGLIQKCDGHFLTDFQVSMVSAESLSKTGKLFIGSYPSTDYEAQLLRSNQIDAAINLMT